MGIYDREYYRDETGGSGFFSGVAPACKALILINVLVFIAHWGTFRSPWWSDLAVSGDAVFRHFRVWHLLTAPFVHDSGAMFPLLWNMLFLWMVGRELEALYGSREFTFMYLAAAAFSTLCWAAVDALAPRGGAPQFLGASGAVLALVVQYVLYYPRRELLLFFVLPVQAWILLAVYLGFQAFSMLNELRSGQGFGVASTAFAGQAGGAAYGYAYKAFDLRWTRLLSRRRKPRLRVVGTEVRERDWERAPSPIPTPSARSASVGASRPAPADHFPEEQLDERLDEVLAKIAREGRSGLTEEENRILQEASRRARDRRSDRV